MNKKIVLIFIGIILGIASYGVYTFYQVSNPQFLFKDIEKELSNEEETNDISQEQNEDSEEETAPSVNLEPDQEEPYKFNGEQVNVLLLGLDASVERYSTMKSFRTDTIMLVSIDFSNQSVHILSIPRDSYVQIPGEERKEKINAAFARGGGFKGQGFEKTMETVTQFLGGVPVQYYMAVDMNVVKEIIDIMGGIDYEVDIDVTIAGRTLKKGFQHLDGQQVLDYSRTRHTGRGDIDRVERQQKIVLAIFNQLKSTKQIMKIPQIYNTVMDKVHTNMNLKQIAALALFGTKLERDAIEPHTVPGGFVNLEGISYWGIDQYKKQELIKDVFGVDIKIDDSEDLKYLKEQMEEQRKVLMEAVHKGQAAINAGNGTLVAYRESLKDSEKAELENGIRLIKDAIEEGDIEEIYGEAGELHKRNGIIQPLVDKRHKAIQNAWGVLTDVTEKSKVYQGALLENEKNGLKERVDHLQQVIRTKEGEAIGQAAKDLNVYASQVFKSCEQRQNQQETPQEQSQQ